MEIIDRVYEVAWAHIEAHNLYRNTEKDREQEDALCKRIFACAGSGRVDFNTLCDEVLAVAGESWTSSSPLSTADS